MKRLKKCLMLAAITPAFLVTSGPPAGADHNTCSFHDVPSVATGTLNTTNTDDWWSHDVGTIPVTTYTITMSGGDADLAVFGPNSCTTPACNSARGGTATDSCKVVGTGRYFVRVYLFSGSSVNYTLSITSP